MTDGIVSALRSVRHRITEIGSYTGSVVAADSNGLYVSPDNPACVVWSVDGALDLETGGTNTKQFEESCQCLYSVMSQPTSLALYVQNHSHDDVLALLDKAIARAEGKL